MATITQERCRVGYTISGNSAEIRTAPEGASQTYKAGAMLFMSASGRLRVLPTNAHISRPDFGQGIAGMAIADAGNYTNSTTIVSFHVANDDTVFLTNVSSRTSTATATLALVQRGSVFSGSNNASRFYVNVKTIAATNSMVVVRDLIDNVGDTNGRVYFQFLRTMRAFR